MHNCETTCAARRTEDGGGLLPAQEDAGGAGGYWPAPLDAVGAAFRLLTTGPRPLALHAARIAEGLPDRLVPLDEITVLLLRPGVSAAARNKVWAELVRRARSGSPAWTVGLTGVALPGLTRAAADLRRPPMTAITATWRPSCWPGSSPRSAAWTSTTWTASRWPPA